MRLRSLGVIFCLLSASVALGDGCYVPERAVRKIPEITAQQAVLRWKDGVETLIITSALDSQAQTLGWIIPVPAVPTSIEKTTPGALRTLDFCIQPKIIHDLSWAATPAVVLVFVANLVVAAWLFQRERLGCLLFLLVSLFVLYGLLLPAAAGVQSGGWTRKIPDVRVEKTAVVGAYAISVLRPSQPEGLNAWLDENAFARLPDAAGPIVADYIARGWVFAAIKLTRNEAGASAPHPIRLSFPSKEAVYPLKLTALAGGKPDFALFVIADARASCDQLAVEFCDRFVRYEDEERKGAETRARFSGKSTRCGVAHPALCGLMWDGCVLTKLVGSVDAGRMNKDLLPAWQPFRSHQERFFSQRGVASLMVVLFAVLVGGWNIVLMRDYAKGLARLSRVWLYCAQRILPAIALAAIVAGGCFAIVPKIGDAEIHVSSASRLTIYWHKRKVSDALVKNPAVLTRPQEEIVAFLLQSLREAATDESPVRNSTTGTELKVEDSPGNFTVEKTPDKVLIRFYSSLGQPFVDAYPLAAGQPDPAAGSDRGSRR